MMDGLLSAIFSTLAVAIMALIVAGLLVVGIAIGAMMF